MNNIFRINFFEDSVHAQFKFAFSGKNAIKQRKSCKYSNSKKKFPKLWHGEHVAIGVGHKKFGSQIPKKKTFFAECQGRHSVKRPSPSARTMALGEEGSSPSAAAS
jgi:hypothetical protein